jgi:hypothetical protein
MKSKYIWNPGDIEIEEPEKETPVDKAIKAMGEMIHDDGTGMLEPVMRKGDLGIFDEGDVFTVRKWQEGVIKKIDKKTVTDEFWEKLRKEGWVDTDLDEDEDDEEE